jgi:hypothetical protein
VNEELQRTLEKAAATQLEALSLHSLEELRESNGTSVRTGLARRPGHVQELLPRQWGTRQRSWLRYYATGRK